MSSANRNIISHDASFRISIANAAENPLDLADFASIWRKIFAFSGLRISTQVLADFFQNRGSIKKILQWNIKQSLW